MSSQQNNNPNQQQPKQPSVKPNLPQDIIKSSGLANLNQEQIKRGVYVSNISAKATLKSVSDFFSFCGPIEKLVMDFDSTSNPNDVKQFAVVVFEHEKDYSTALLLGNARIIDSPINVYPYSQVLPSFKEGSQQQSQKKQPGRVSSFDKNSYI